jgi:hypothetical protein
VTRMRMAGNLAALRQWCSAAGGWWRAAPPARTPSLPGRAPPLASRSASVTAFAAAAPAPGPLRQCSPPECRRRCGRSPHWRANGCARASSTAPRRCTAPVAVGGGTAASRRVQERLVPSAGRPVAWMREAQARLRSLLLSGDCDSPQSAPARGGRTVTALSRTSSRWSGRPLRRPRLRRSTAPA